ncbi:mCG145085, partial [Mus musculus]
IWPLVGRTYALWPRSFKATSGAWEDCSQISAPYCTEVLSPRASSLEEEADLHWGLYSHLSSSERTFWLKYEELMQLPDCACGVARFLAPRPEVFLHEPYWKEGLGLSWK